MANRTVSYTVRVHDEGEQGLWAEVLELPGCFAAGNTLDELYESLEDGIGLYLSESGKTVQAHVERGVSEERRTFELCDA